MMELDNPIFFQPASDLVRTPILLKIAIDERHEFICELDGLGLVFMALFGQSIGLLCRYPLSPLMRFISRERVLWERPSACAIWFI
jgi:hypothetical protein